MKTILKSIITSTLAVASASCLCSCGDLMDGLAGFGNVPTFTNTPHVARHRPPASHHVPLPTAGQIYTAVNTYRNPMRRVHDAAGRGLAGLVPWYGVGNDPNYQRRAADAYGHLSGRGRIGGVTLREASGY